MSNLELPPTALALIHTDGSCNPNPGPMGIGFTVETEGAGVILRAGHSVGLGTNNQAEYRALIEALRHTLRMGLYRAEVRSDSLLVVNQMNGVWKLRDPSLRAVYTEAYALSSLFQSFSIHHIPRELNSAADELSRQMVLDRAPLPPLRRDGRRSQRKLHEFMASALRVWYNMGEQNLYRLSRLAGVSEVTVDSIAMNRTYRHSGFDDLPDWTRNPNHAALESYEKGAQKVFQGNFEWEETELPSLTL